jgi:hypothetical protein
MSDTLIALADVLTDLGFQSIADDLLDGSLESRLELYAAIDWHWGHSDQDIEARIRFAAARAAVGEVL